MNKNISKKIIFFLGFFVIFLSIIFLIINTEANSYVIIPKNTPTIITTAMILGASVMQNGKLSLILKDRADTVINLYNQNKVASILISGDSINLTHNEVGNIEEYLVANNIPKKDIILDKAGVDTYSSMYRAKNIFHINSLLVVTQSFHLPRALFIARNLGVDAYGISADRHHYRVYNYIREIFANVKAVFDLLTFRKVN